MKKFNILIGGNGFIGKNFQEKYKENNEEYFILDKTYLLEENGYIVDFITISDKEIENIIDKIFEKLSNFDPNDLIVIQHLACNLGVENVINHPEYLYEDILLNNNLRKFFTKLINKLHDKKFKNIKFLYYSTSEVYGPRDVMSPDYEYIIQSVLKENKRTRYAISKALNEFLWKEFCDLYDIRYIIIRPFNVIGRFQSENFVIPKMIKSALEENVIYIYGNGDQKRTFIDVEDFVNAVEEIIKNEDNFEIYNISNLKLNLSISKLAEIIKNILELKKLAENIEIKKIEVNENQIGDKNRVPDVRKMYKLYRPKKCIKDSIYDYLFYQGYSI